MLEMFIEAGRRDNYEEIESKENDLEETEPPNLLWHQ
jgi:hypothetical protein